MEDVYDVIIIGTGIAGLTAAVYTARANLKTLVFGDINRSMLINAQAIGNYLGTDGLSGRELLEKSLEQVKKYGAEVAEKNVIHAAKEGELFSVKTEDGAIYKSKTLVIASGVALKPSGIVNEKTFLGKGVHTCVACDGYFYKNKKVAIIGNRNYAAEEAIQLLALTKDITMISHAGDFGISENFMKEIKDSVKFLIAKVEEFRGDKFLKEVVLDNGTAMSFDGVFLASGTATSLAFCEKLGLEKNGNYIAVDNEGRTSLDGVYAAGSCVGGNLQAAKSAGEGCNAGIDVIKKIKGLESYSDLS